MTKIAVTLKDNSVYDVVISNPENYKDKEGWILVDNNPAFSIDERFAWTVRKSDTKLVLASTNQTPDENQNTINGEVLKQLAETGAKVDQLATAFGAYMKADVATKSTETTETTTTEKVGN